MTEQSNSLRICCVFTEYLFFIYYTKCLISFFDKSLLDRNVFVLLSCFDMLLGIYVTGNTQILQKQNEIIRF